MNRIFTFLFLKRSSLVYMITFLWVFQTMVAQETAPTIQCSNLVVTNTTGTSATISWREPEDAGKETFYKVFVRKGTSTSSNAIPLDNVYYFANSYFGSGDQIGTSGWYCVANTRSNSLTIDDLTPETTYQVQVFVNKYYQSSNHTFYLRTINSGNSVTLTTPKKSNVATLSNLSLSAGTLDPVFSSETTDYKARVSNEVSSIRVTLVATNANARIKVNGVTEYSGKPSDKIDLTEGDNTIGIEVTAEDGTVKKYTVTIEKNSLRVVDNKIEGFAVYPNPVQEGKIYIQTKSTVAKNVKIFDVSGKKVLSVQTTDREVNIGDLQKGVYIMKVNQDGAEATEKLIVE
ncbi:cadherin-like beta sandwich domain-containing protein [Flavobacterium sp. N502540]|uniref:cadherin-like beta sandwich domain-containing protein n=1 Tax=Flavobacterium sp. N502540 TaxID=2986838 RepID=UPI00222458F7|nr:cadherin-like beta sandwich domain-containing protein [Flavobacterium sp. N502540]